MTSDETPTPEPVDPNQEPEQIRSSATGVVVPDDESATTGEPQAEVNREDEPPA